MSGVGVMTARELVEEELVYGALRREQLWRMIGLSGAGLSGWKDGVSGAGGARG